jgi:hypothetical protein
MLKYSSLKANWILLTGRIRIRFRSQLKGTDLLLTASVAEPHILMRLRLRPLSYGLYSVKVS